MNGSLFGGSGGKAGARYRVLQLIESAQRTMSRAGTRFYQTIITLAKHYALSAWVSLVGIHRDNVFGGQLT